MPAILEIMAAEKPGIMGPGWPGWTRPGRAWYWRIAVRWIRSVVWIVTFILISLCSRVWWRVRWIKTGDMLNFGDTVTSQCLTERRAAMTDTRSGLKLGWSARWCPAGLWTAISGGMRIIIGEITLLLNRGRRLTRNPNIGVNITEVIWLRRHFSKPRFGEDDHLMLWRHHNVTFSSLVWISFNEISLKWLSFLISRRTAILCLCNSSEIKWACRCALLSQLDYV